MERDRQAPLCLLSHTRPQAWQCGGAPVTTGSKTAGEPAFPVRFCRPGACLG